MIDLIDAPEVCRLFGGIHRATLYRHVRLGHFPKPIHVGRLSRWLRDEVEDVLAGMVRARKGEAQ
jgi:predicted DNA-binding transcriptional regulator AlpA